MGAMTTAEIPTTDVGPLATDVSEFDPNGDTSIAATGASRVPLRAANGRFIREGVMAAPAADGLIDDRFLDREISWLQFNERVLHLAADPDVPLLERARFLAIFTSNLDEFFMVRVAGLKRRIATGIAVRSASGLEPREVLEKISNVSAELLGAQARIFHDEVRPALDEVGKARLAPERHSRRIGEHDAATRAVPQPGGPGRGGDAAHGFIVAARQGVPRRSEAGGWTDSRTIEASFRPANE